MEYAKVLVIYWYEKEYDAMKIHQRLSAHLPNVPRVFNNY
jgi:hypothetical protein